MSYATKTKNREVTQSPDEPSKRQISVQRFPARFEDPPVQERVGQDQSQNQRYLDRYACHQEGKATEDVEGNVPTT